MYFSIGFYNLNHIITRFSCRNVCRLLNNNFVIKEFSVVTMHGAKHFLLFYLIGMWLYVHIIWEQLKIKNSNSKLTAFYI